ncbi:hypothetical protein DL89DRAFT_14900 [Linderina pennispora]|uniref:Uncharacterized protein n=1 Tax=Linderina pennispora TaxID=61395 RepID=A0A1Y1WLH9_9FUNG|nr:uncharacterized protein DL89DRAFT_14900 [Linderina pennispora]ORX74363.1 hypothetical protein DL89DRAFT_14900 [Linderina pennispora]
MGLSYEERDVGLWLLGSLLWPARRFFTNLPCPHTPTRSEGTQMACPSIQWDSRRPGCCCCSVCIWLVWWPLCPGPCLFERIRVASTRPQKFRNALFASAPPAMFFLPFPPAIAKSMLTIVRQRVQRCRGDVLPSPAA